MKKESLYDVLGVNSDASNEEIKKSFREKAKKYHPDSSEGDRDTFEKIKHASLVLLDPTKRKRYDETGEEDSGPDHTQTEAMTIIMSILGKILAQDSPQRMNITSIIKTNLEGMKKEGYESIENIKTEINKFEKLEKRFIKKNKGPNIFSISMRSNIRRSEEQIENCNKKIAVIDLAIQIMGDYSFEVEAPSPTEPKKYKDLEDMVHYYLKGNMAG